MIVMLLGDAKQIGCRSLGSVGWCETHWWDTQIMDRSRFMQYAWSPCATWRHTVVIAQSIQSEGTHPVKVQGQTYMELAEKDFEWGSSWWQDVPRDCSGCPGGSKSDAWEGYETRAGYESWKTYLMPRPCKDRPFELDNLTGFPWGLLDMIKLSGSASGHASYVLSLSLLYHDLSVC
ncbi:hypothetical protein B0H17DRAFT_1152832 [Mycena rosella]|uniref:Uncharacterized protein n=1 Tax=Mycena rosella TaxID=1033263 RepID=A0AAD7FCI3_MYCRO|nr:hypothetical protein B0H17DRAFT_1152832 [Mycena rosella]